MTTGPTFGIGLHAGLLIHHDAISYSALLKLDILRRWQRAGAPLHIQAFANGSDLGDPDIWVGHMGRAYLERMSPLDLHIFEFGIWFDLFDAVFTLDDPERALVVYHNITPPELLDDPPARVAAGKALQQKHNLAHVGHVACVSGFNLADLLAFGLPAERLSVLPLPPPRPAPPGPVLARRGTPDGPVELLFVGRLVRPKGLVDLLDALEVLPPGTPAVRLTVVGNVAISDPLVVALVQARADSSSGRVDLVGRVDDRRVDELYRSSHALVLPSYHEGYCVPVLEALMARTPVIAGRAGNLPSILAGLGRTVVPGEVAGLADAVAAHAHHVAAARSQAGSVIETDTGAHDEGDWRRSVQTHLDDHGRDAFEALLRWRLIEAASRIDRPGARALLDWMGARTPG